ncbi:MAG: glycosyltransferase family 4 protein, partial [Armatimonadota bacterium]
EYYHTADLFLFPGHAEGFGLVAVEAAACGLPVLMTRIGVAERLIEDGVSGYLIDQDATKIAAHLTELAASSELRQRLGWGAQQAAQKFSWDRQAAEIEAGLQRGL